MQRKFHFLIWCSKLPSSWFIIYRIAIDIIFCVSLSILIWRPPYQSKISSHLGWSNFSCLEEHSFLVCVFKMNSSNICKEQEHPEQSIYDSKLSFQGKKKKQIGKRVHDNVWKKEVKRPQLDGGSRQVLWEQRTSKDHEMQRRPGWDSRRRQPSLQSLVTVVCIQYHLFCAMSWVICISILWTATIHSCLNRFRRQFSQSEVC